MNKIITFISIISLAIIIASCGNEQKSSEETSTSKEIVNSAQTDPTFSLDTDPSFWSTIFS